MLFRNVALQEALAASTLLPGLDDRDRAFARALITTALRRRGQIDATIAEFLERPLPPAAR
ncbi:MAG: MFS transporter, partial [Rhodospirillales bacterium]|nr:MFS transporter [Rhodospirillales bacterium]